MMITDKKETVVILGISDSTERYSYKAFNSLQNHGYTNLIGVTPKSLSLKGVELVSDFSEITKQVHTLTLYVGPQISSKLIDKILELNPKRIIMNPGTENQELKDRAEMEGIEVIEGCTLVMLSTSQF